ncbi:MAG: MerR family transcriptional regulator [Clostridiales bacterium]|nr:MerR family transcriptional regulator [Clostridiales bacterium]
MRINEVEQLVGISKKNIRFYESEGLLHPGRESDNGYRSYSTEDVRILQAIHLLRRLALPIDDIRALQSGEKSLSLCMESHLSMLRVQSRSLEQTQKICGELAAQHVSLDDLDIARYEREMQEMEEGGIRFMSVKNDKKSKKKIAPLICALVFIFLFGLFIGFLLWANGEDPLPWPITTLFVGIFVALIVGVILALVERLKEINKGEEDEAFKY